MSSKKLWLGSPDKFARLRKIEALDVAQDYREITMLFYGDFQSTMLAKSFNGFTMNFAAPRISRVLGSTGELDDRIAKRVVDTILLASKVMTEGFVGEGRDAARRVNAMHKRYDIATEDFIVVGCEEVVGSIELAEKYGWREVTDKERAAVLLYYSHQTRAFGSPQGLPDTYEGAKAFFSDYLDAHARYEPQNERLANHFIGWYGNLVPAPLRPIIGLVLKGQMDDRIARACGIKPASKPIKAFAHALLKMVGSKDPIPDGTPSRLEPLIRSVYPNGYQIADLGSHGEKTAKAAELV